MKITDMLQEYHSMPACDRMDLICRMLRHCVPYEMHFLGAVLLDGVKNHFKTHISKVETNANRVNYYSTIKEGGLTHETCEKLCCALAVLHADNRPVAEIIFNMLNDSQVLLHCEESNDMSSMQDFRLLYVMAVNHPALSFIQRQHLMYMYLQRLDSILVEKSKFSFSGSFSTSLEKTLTSEVDGDSLPECTVREPQPSPDAYIMRCEVHSVYKRLSDKRYVYMIQVEWSDGISYTVRRTYGDFFSFQTKLLDLFPEEGGQKGKKHTRLIPYLPGKNYSKFLKNREVAEKRLPELHRYSRELTSLPNHVSHSPHVLEFYRPKPTDIKEDYPPLHKITNLYDLIDSGKVRNRVFSDALKRSPTHSPSPHPHHFHQLHNHNSSPLHRIMQTSGTAATASSTSAADSSLPSRIWHTLPPTTSLSAQQGVDEDHASIAARRPTFPFSSRQQLQKSETSAFTPVGQNTLSDADLASTVTLTASVMSIPDSSSTVVTGSLCHSHANTDLQSTLTSTTPTDAFVTSSHIARFQSGYNFIHETKSMRTSPISEPSSSVSVSSSLDNICNSSHVRQALPNFTEGRTCFVSGEDEDDRIMIGSMPPEGYNAPFTSGLAGNISWQQSQAERPQRSRESSHTSISPTQQTISPTPMISPSFLGSASPGAGGIEIPSMTSPSPTHSLASNPKGRLAYTHQPIMVYAPYSPIYFYSQSPLPSPLASPNTSNSKLVASSSYIAINRGVTDSLLKWLKSLRLHKYHSIFENLTYDEMCMLTVEDLEKRSMTTGAAKKLFKKLEELKLCQFVGFRDMPFSGYMTRKSSTCSLPAALLTEQGITPSSSCDGFSPTGSTCSLDKYGPTHSSSKGANGGGRGNFSSSSKYHRHTSTSANFTQRKEHRHSHNEQTISPVSLVNGSLGPGGGGGGIVDPVVMKVITSSSNKTDLPSSHIPSQSLHQQQPPSQTGNVKSSDKNLDRDRSILPTTARTSESTDIKESGITPTSLGSPTLNDASWADEENRSSSASDVCRPEWAQMLHSNGEPGSVGMKCTPPISSSVLGQPGMGHLVNTGMIHMTSDLVGTLHPHSHHSIMHPQHTPPKHALLTSKRNLSFREERLVAKDNIVVPLPLHPSAIHGCVTEVSSNWNMQHQIPSLCYPQQQQLHHSQHLHPSTMAAANAVRGQHLTLQYSHTQPNHNNSSANGLLRIPMCPPPHTRMPLFPAGTEGMLPYTGVEAQLPSHVMCFNCGKKGHYGTSCPGMTMVAESSSSFQKQLERLCQPAKRTC